MIKILYILPLLLMFSVVVSAEDFKEYVNDKGEKIVKGDISLTKWIEIVGLDSVEMKSYKVKQDLATEIGIFFAKDQSLNLVFVVGAWCGDTKDELPKLLKIMELAGITPDRFHLTGVDRDKIISGTYNFVTVEKIPGVIVYRNSKEIGRIEELPSKSWEADLLNIFKN